MKKLLIMCACVLIVGFITGQTFAIQYCKDANPTAPSDKSFEEEVVVSGPGTVLVDIWINDLVSGNKLITGGFQFSCNQYLNVTNVIPNDNGPGGLGGPWDWSGTGIMDCQGNPLTYPAQCGRMCLLQFSCVSPDAGQDILLGRLQIAYLGGGTGKITISTIPGIDTNVEYQGVTFDSQMCSNTFRIRVEEPEIEVICNDGIDNDGDQDIDCADEDCDGSPCDDGLYCTVCNTCANGSCQSGRGNPCKPPNVCNEDTSSCEEPPECKVDADCDDQNGCTTDSCVSGSCVNTNNTAPCDDGLYCTVGDMCANGSCQSGTGNPCTPPNVCNEDTNSCGTTFKFDFYGGNTSYTQGTFEDPQEIRLAEDSTVLVDIYMFGLPDGTNLGAIDWYFEWDTTHIEVLGNPVCNNLKPAPGQFDSYLFDDTFKPIGYIFQTQAEQTVGIPCPTIQLATYVLHSKSSTPPCGGATVIKAKNEFASDPLGLPILVDDATAAIRVGMCGDVYSNGVVDLFDMIEAINIALGFETGMPSNCQIDIGELNVQPSGNASTEISLTNINDKVRTLQLDICDMENYLTCTRCEPTARTAGFSCFVQELENGCCRVVLVNFEYAYALIDEGTGPIFTLQYDVSSDAPEGCCILYPERGSSGTSVGNPKM